MPIAPHIHMQKCTIDIANTHACNNPSHCHGVSLKFIQVYLIVTQMKLIIIRPHTAHKRISNAKLDIKNNNIEFSHFKTD